MNPKVNTGKKRYEGKYFTNNDNETFKVLSYNNAKDILVEFEDGTKTTTRAYLINVGTVRNPNFHNKKLLYNKCCLGIGKYNSKSYFYSIWFKLIQRCFDENIRLNLPTYINTTLDEKWTNFQNFAEWCELNYKEGFDLDKDILFDNNKHYSPETCCFVPHELNTLFRDIKNQKSLNIDLPNGVTICNDRDSKKYLSKILFEGKKVYIGHFDIPEEAGKAYNKFRKLKIKFLAEKYKDVINQKVYDRLIYLANQN